MKRVETLLTVTMLLLSAGLAKADTVALTAFSGGFNSTSGSDQLYGWFFSISSAIDVTALGVGDTGSDGLAIAHDVGIFRLSDSSLMTSATVPAGLAATLLDGFRYVSVGPVALAAGSYVVVMTMPELNGDTQSILNDSVTTSSPVTYDGSAFDGGSSLAIPNVQGAFAEGLFGPNFQFASEVPEPASLFLVAAAGLGLIVRRRLAK